MRNVVVMHELDTLSGVSDTIGIQDKECSLYFADLFEEGDKLSVRLKTGLVKWT
jgi:hypothetical protein